MLETDYRPIYISIITGWYYVSKDYTPKYHKQVFKVYLGYQFCSLKSNNFTHNSGSASFIQYGRSFSVFITGLYLYAIFKSMLASCKFTSVHKHSLGIQM